MDSEDSKDDEWEGEKTKKEFKYILKIFDKYESELREAVNSKNDEKIKVIGLKIFGYIMKVTNGEDISDININDDFLYNEN